jgi:hypothetical protein
MSPILLSIFSGGPPARRRAYVTDSFWRRANEEPADRAYVTDSFSAVLE